MGDKNNQTMNASLALMASMAENFALQNSISSLPYFDGKNIPLKDFLQAVRNGLALLPEGSDQVYVTAV
ncbi:hypothetical protein DD595_25595, partial [Enterobacter cloacae complex sp. 4DZ3-17B2]|uniref:hypothetical protein n=1 Tax=Enterobacter cloacae complex sp. 4DZ3-17B2 TaxID=2511990 RepID=UPI001026E84E